MTDYVSDEEWAVWEAERLAANADYKRVEDARRARMIPVALDAALAREADLEVRAYVLELVAGASLEQLSEDS